jgi:hypothetical protein
MRKLVGLLTVFAVFVIAALAWSDGTPPSGAPTVKLVSAGSGTKSVMRFHLKKGDAQSMQMTMLMKMRAGTTTAVELPPMRMSMSLSVVDVSTSGDFRVKWTLDNVGVDAGSSVGTAQVDQMRALFAGIAGMSGHMVVTDRGFLRSSEVELPPSMDPKLRQVMESVKQSMGQMASPLPEEPVGPGASWEVTADLTQGGMTIHQRTLNELVARTGDTGKMKVTITQTAGAQSVSAPGMPAGVKADLNSMNGHGTGSNEFDLSKLAPTRGESKISADLSMTMQGRTLDLTTEVQVDVSSR